ncbi:MAG: 4-coumarate--CoA ligase [Pseudomonadota bacterium]
MRDTPSPSIVAGPPWPAEALASAPEALQRMLLSVIADERARLFRRPVPPEEWRTWNNSTRLDEDGLGFDSLARLDLIARLTRLFQLQRSGVEDYLVVRPQIGDWVEIVATGLRHTPAEATLSFETSGSTGVPKSCVHPITHLAREIASLAPLLSGVRRIVALVPPHHLYGFQFTVLGPTLDHRPVQDARGEGLAGVITRAQPGDALVATPYQWTALARTGVRFGKGIGGIVSAGACPPPLWAILEHAGLERLLEIYGATETAGIGWRTAAKAPFTLFQHLDRAGEQSLCHDGTALDLPDRLQWSSPRHFELLGRRDDAIKIGGTNVFPAHIAAQIATWEGVAACAVRPDSAAVEARLKAFVVPKNPDLLSDAKACQSLEAALRAQASQALSVPERPVSYRFGTALPVSETGKPMDWPTLREE